MPQKKTTKPNIKLKKAPIAGDLVYCHCIGSKMGWYLNKVGLVLKENIKETNDRFRYEIYVLDEARFMHASAEDFQKDSIEVISGYSADQISNLKESIMRIETDVALERR